MELLTVSSTIEKFTKCIEEELKKTPDDEELNNYLKTKKYEITTKCVLCNHDLLCNKGIIKCSNVLCNRIHSESTDYGAEWRNDDTGDGEDKTRCGMPINPMLLVSSYAIRIAPHQGSNKKLYNNIIRYITWNSKPYVESSLEERFSNIEFKCKNHGISDAIITSTQRIYYDILQKYGNSNLDDVAIGSKHKKKTKRGNNNQGLQAASLLQAFNEEGCPKSYKEVADIFEINVAYVTVGIKLMQSYIDDTKVTTISKMSNYNNYMKKFADILHLPTSYRDEIMNIINIAVENRVIDNFTPPTVVTGVIFYISCIRGYTHINKTLIETNCNVSYMSISKVCDKLLSYGGLFII